ncbi:hypothetical protein BDP27DRAFT_1249841, partial [Rhodocollybia butyracea]
QKAKRRARIAATMIDHCRDENDNDGLQFWEYSLRLTGHLGDGGMSEDEDSFETVRIDCRTEKVRVKVVKDLDFRHTSIAAHYEQVDTTPQHGVEDLIFSGQIQHRIERIRVSDITVRSPPEGLSASVYRPGYLENLLPHELSALRLDPNPFHLYQLNNEETYFETDTNLD